jgi:hypothetical protein
MSLVAGLIVIAATGPFRSMAAERASAKEPEHLSVEAVLSGLPVDTEAIDVAQSFDLQLIDWNTVKPDAPGIEVVGKLRRAGAGYSKIGDVLP